MLAARSCSISAILSCLSTTSSSLIASMSACKSSIFSAISATASGGTIRRFTTSGALLTMSLSIFLVRGPSSASVMARPFLPARAVLPTLCTYSDTFLGTSKFMTTSMPLISRPRPARSVAMRKSTDPALNFSSASRRWACVRFPCSSSTLSPSSPKMTRSLCARFFSRQKTIVRVLNERVQRHSRMASRCDSCSLRMRMNSWLSVVGTATLFSVPSPSSTLMELSAVMRTGRLSE
mmetsp:Transcript_26821/g.66083  ORF Transcript_26821/g.66083 Transcript_26821/m.66083 type:complete len:236 (+) Transcript_26821:699-1406(+)